MKQESFGFLTGCTPGMGQGISLKRLGDSLSRLTRWTVGCGPHTVLGQPTTEGKPRIALLGSGFSVLLGGAMIADLCQGSSQCLL